MREKKKIVSLLLCLALALGFLPQRAGAAVVTSQVSASQDYGRVNELPAGRPGVDNIIASAGVSVSEGHISVQFTLEAEQSNGTSAKGTTVAAALMSAEDYVSAGKFQNRPNSINNTNYASLTGANAVFYRAGACTLSGDALSGSIPLPDLRKRPMDVEKATADDCYYDDYVLVLFNVAEGAGSEGKYTVLKFQVDSEGNLKDEPSYMVRYLKNTASVGTKAEVKGKVDQQIIRPAAADTAITTQAYTRTGYTFLGWDEDSAFVDLLALDDKNAVSPNLAAALKDEDLKAAIDYWHEDGGTVSGKPADTIVNLYAQWRPIPVTLAAGTMPDEARVGQPFTYAPVIGGAEGTAKTLSVSAEDVKWLQDHGLRIENDGKKGGPCITGTPTDWTEGEKTVTLTATDGTNKTTATLAVTLPKIEMGRQNPPDRDVNTGLQARILTETAPAGGDGEEAAQDGQIFGFYSLGQSPQEDATQARPDGTGSYRADYLARGMVYEYRPLTVAGEAFDDDAAPETGVPWRELPAPAELYDHDGVPDGPDNAELAASMALGATARVKTTISVGLATIETLEGEYPAWPDAYGGIQFEESGLPVVSGLSEGDVYEVRFRANDTFAPSEPVEVEIKNTAGGGGTGGGDPSDFVSIVFYDWDESTILGSIVVKKGEDATTAVEAFTNGLISPLSKDAPDNADENAPYFVDDDSFPLSQKRGYSFYGWIPHDSELYTHCGRAMDGNNKQITVEAPRKEKQTDGDGEIQPQQTQDFTNLSESVIVKSCYIDNEELLYNPASPGAMYYSTEYTDYNRVGNSINYSITISIARETVDENLGVPKMFDPMLKVTSTLTAGGTQIAFYAIENVDESSFTFYPSTAISKVQCNVVDMYQVTNKGAVSNKSGNINEIQGTGTGMDGFLWKGTVGMIADAVATNTLNLLTAQVLQNQGNLPLKDSGVSAAEAQKYLRQAWIIKNSDNGTEDTLLPEAQRSNLTYQEMAYAIANAGAWVKLDTL